MTLSWTLQRLRKGWRMAGMIQMVKFEKIVGESEHKLEVGNLVKGA